MLLKSLRLFSSPGIASKHGGCLSPQRFPKSPLLFESRRTNRNKASVPAASTLLQPLEHVQQPPAHMLSIVLPNFSKYPCLTQKIMTITTMIQKPNSPNQNDQQMQVRRDCFFCWRPSHESSCFKAGRGEVPPIVDSSSMWTAVLKRFQKAGSRTPDIAMMFGGCWVLRIREVSGCVCIWNLSSSFDNEQYRLSGRKVG